MQSDSTAYCEEYGLVEHLDGQYHIWVTTFTMAGGFRSPKDMRILDGFSTKEEAFIYCDANGIELAYGR